MLKHFTVFALLTLNLHFAVASDERDLSPSHAPDTSQVLRPRAQRMTAPKNTSSGPSCPQPRVQTPQDNHGDPIYVSFADLILTRTKLSDPIIKEAVQDAIARGNRVVVYTKELLHEDIFTLGLGDDGKIKFLEQFGLNPKFYSL